MGLINPSRGVLDLDGFRDVKPLFEAAMEAGIWIVLRPGAPIKYACVSFYLETLGPYINAETSAGGISHWITSEVEGTTRTNASDYRDAWMDYIKKMIEVTVPYQITRGGPVIGGLGQPWHILM